MSTDLYKPRVVALISHLHLPETPSRLARVVQDVIPQYAQYAQVEVVDTSLSDLLHTAQELEKQNGVDVFICSGATAQYLRRHLSTTVLSIRMGEYDLIKALDLARSRSTKVAILSYGQVHTELEEMAALFTVDIRQASYTTLDEARAQIKQLVTDGFRVIVGSSTAIELAEEAGAEGIPSLNAKAICRALDDALAICRSRTLELVKHQRLNAVLKHLTDGVIALDNQGVIQSLNPTMATFLEISAESALGKPLTEVIPALNVEEILLTGIGEENRVVKIGQRTLAINIMPIFEEGQQEGAVIACQEMTAIQQADRRIRSQSRPRQFIAKYHFHQIAGESSGHRETIRLAERYAPTDSTVLITGESGTGKELLAQSIHNASPRQHGPFVPINCAAFPETLLESELFGYEDGAFTGSRKGGKTGLFEAGHTGTVFLDEIGDMPATLQTRLLRVLQEREVLRLGASEPTPIDIRVIAATHCDLRSRINDGSFREDLYYRLNILRVEVPPLRERLSDIPILAGVILKKITNTHRHAYKQNHFLSLLMPHLLEYRWPGNIRELENIIERAALSSEDINDDSGLSTAFRTLFPELFEGKSQNINPSIPSTQAHNLRSLSKAAEVAHIQQILEACGGDMDEAARQLGISRSTLWRRLRPVQSS